jgi:hypothetical protein
VLTRPRVLLTAIFTVPLSLSLLRRHPYVDLGKPTVIADFWRPVALVDPSIAA